MLDRISEKPLSSAASGPGQRGFSWVRIITAKAFKRALRRADPTELAVMAHDLAYDLVALDLPVKQACAVMGATPTYVYFLHSLTSGQLADVRAGRAKLAHLMAAKARRQVRQGGDGALGRRHDGDAGSAHGPDVLLNQHKIVAHGRRGAECDSAILFGKAN
jgi:hypothetical protein